MKVSQTGLLVFAGRFGGMRSRFDGTCIGFPIGWPGRGSCCCGYDPGKLGGRVVSGTWLGIVGLLLDCEA